MGNAFRILDWLIEPALNAVSANGTTVRLEPKVMQVLVCLAEQAGTPVSKEELLRRVWPETFVTDDVLIRAICELRRVFADHPQQSQVIQTIPKRGYRLMVPVRPIELLSAPESPPATLPHPGRVRPLLQAVLLLMVVAIVFAVGETWAHRTGSSSSAGLGSSSKGAQNSGRPTVVMPFNPQAVEAYLQGQYHYRKAREQIFHYRGQKHFEEELKQAEALYAQATAADPNYAAAYVAMAEAAMVPTYYEYDRRSREKAARAAIARALAIDPNSADAHLRWGKLEFSDWHWADAEREFHRAIELNPNIADAHLRYSELLNITGRMDEGRRESEKSQAIEPTNSRVAWEYYVRRQYDRFIELKRNDAEIGAFGAMAHYDLGYGYERAGKYKEAVEEWVQAMDGLGYHQLASALNHGYARAGFSGAMREWVAGWERLHRQGEPVHPELPAYIYSLLGDHDRAFGWLEVAYERHTYGMAFLKIDPTWDNIRDDERFDQLVRRVGIPR